MTNFISNSPATLYYEKLPKKQPTGLLYQEYNRTRLTKATARSVTKTQDSEEVPDVLLTDDTRSSIDFSNNEHNYTEETDESSIIHHWNLTFDYRNKNYYAKAEDFINDWLPLQKLDGYIMVDADFVKSYGTVCALSLKDKWEDFAFINHNVISKDCKDPKEKKALLGAQSENDENIKDRIVMMALHHLSYLMPSPVASEVGIYAPTVLDSKNAFFKIAKNKNLVNAEMKSRKIFCEKRKIKGHPMIFETERSSSNGVQYFIGVGNTIYECSSFIDAVDAAFKIFVTFKIPFPPESVKIWLFLNEIFYKTKLQQKPSAKLISILNYFKL